MQHCVKLGFSLQAMLHTMLCAKSVSTAWSFCNCRISARRSPQLDFGTLKFLASAKHKALTAWTTQHYHSKIERPSKIKHLCVKEDRIFSESVAHEYKSIRALNVARCIHTLRKMGEDNVYEQGWVTWVLGASTISDWRTLELQGQKAWRKRMCFNTL